jgi:hypothetical protein
MSHGDGGGWDAAVMQIRIQHAAIGKALDLAEVSGDLDPVRRLDFTPPDVSGPPPQRLAAVLSDLAETMTSLERRFVEVQRVLSSAVTSARIPRPADPTACFVDRTL